jgi:hypothetical protein
MSPVTACIVAESRTVQYSSPLTFNDPFDVQAGLHFSFDIDSLPGKVLRRLEDLAMSPLPPTVDTEDVWGKLVLLVREHYPSRGIPAVLKTAYGAEPLRRIVRTIRETQRQYQEHWWSRLLPGARVFCVSEVRDNLLMWAHYAQNHTGAVFEFWSLPEEDNLLSVAAPVEYRPCPPSFFSEEEFIDDLLSLKRLDVQSLYRRYAYVKSNHWAYEQEWRVWYPFSDTTDHDFIPIRPAELKAVYFGCRMDREVQTRLTTLLRVGFPGARLLKSHRRSDDYALEFHDA